MIKLNFQPELWGVTPDGSKYRGTRNSKGEPNGLGVLQVDETHFYVGQFSYGKRQGRGLLIYHEYEKRERKEWIRGTYEEVMRTAVFDDCGRVIHVDENVGHWATFDESINNWTIEQDGIWKDDAFVEPYDTSALQQNQWKDLSVTTYEIYSGDHRMHRNSFFDTYTLFDETHLMAYTEDGDVCILGIGEEKYLTPIEGMYGWETHTIIAAPSKDYKQIVDLMLCEPQEKYPTIQKERIYMRTLVALESRLLESQYPPRYFDFAESINNNSKKIKAEFDESLRVAYVHFPHDEWTIWKEDNCLWLHSQLGKRRIRLHNCGTYEFTMFTEKIEQIWKYINEKIQ